MTIISDIYKKILIQILNNLNYILISCVYFFSMKIALNV